VPLRDAHPDYFVPSDDGAVMTGRTTAIAVSCGVPDTVCEAGKSGRRKDNNLAKTLRYWKRARQLNARKPILMDYSASAIESQSSQGQRQHWRSARPRARRRRANVALVVGVLSRWKNLASSIQSDGGTALLFPPTFSTVARGHSP